MTDGVQPGPMYVSRLVFELRRLMEAMSGDGRLTIINAVSRDYCCDCGDARKPGERACQCQNDE